MGTLKWRGDKMAKRRKLKNLSKAIDYAGESIYRLANSLIQDRVRWNAVFRRLQFLANDYALDCSISATIDPPEQIGYQLLDPNQVTAYCPICGKYQEIERPTELFIDGGFGAKIRCSICREDSSVTEWHNNVARTDRTPDMPTINADDASTPDTPFSLFNTQFTTIHITGAKDKRGNPIPLDTITVTGWTLEPNTPLTPLSLDPSANNLACQVTPFAGYVGPATVTVTADADPGVGIVAITRTFTFDIANEVLQAQSLVAEIDEPQDVPLE